MGDSWFRVYNSVRHDRKVARLSDSQFRAWINLLSLASEEGGFVPGDIRDLSHELRLPVGKIRDTLRVLISADLIEPHGDGYAPHNWGDRQFKSDVSRERQKRYRDRHKKRHGDGSNDGQSDVTVTVQDTDTDTDTDVTSLRSVTSPRKRGAAKPKTQLPEQFPAEVNLQWARSYWENHGRADLCELASEQSAAFRDYHVSHGTRSADWDASWRTWAMNAVQFQRKSNGKADDRNSHDKFLAGGLAALEKFKAG